MLAAVVALIVYITGIYNGLVSLRENIKVSWANIDVLLKQRHDELPKLIETCKRYMQFEQDTLERVMRARASVNQASQSGDVAAVGAAEQQLRAGMTRLFAEVTDARVLIRAKELYELFEAAVDRCEDAADVLHGVVLERI
jgi:LemA protein